MELNVTTETRKDISTAAENSTFSARLFEGVVTINVSGLSTPSSTITLTLDALPDLAQFTALVDAELSP